MSSVCLNFFLVNCRYERGIFSVVGFFFIFLGAFFARTVTGLLILESEFFHDFFLLLNLS